MEDESFVIRTKLVPPLREAQLVVRERLLSKLARNADRTLALVKAPAGYGKTTLVCQWFGTLNQVSERGAWYSLEASDNDLGRFFRYLVAAVRLRLPDFGALILGQLDAGMGFSATSLAGAFVNAVATIEWRLHLVLDDFHKLNNAGVLEAMSQIVANAPANLHLVITSRESPVLPLGRLRALGRLAEFNSDELRFCGTETGTFMTLAGHTSLSPQQLHSLEKRTEGWVAGLQLASISLLAREDANEFINAFSGSHRDVVDFLTEDVLQRQDPETRRFLLQTSILERLSPGLCDAVTTEGNARGMLDGLESRSLFIFSLDPDGEWYRYHHLFAEFLRRRLETDASVDLRRLHQRASHWFSEHGYFDEAIQHALAAGDTGRAAQLLNETCDALFYSGRLGALSEWYEQIPRMQLRRFPRILLDQAWKLILEWQFEPARRILDDVSTVIGESSGEERRSPQLLQAILKHREMMYALFRDDMGLVDELCGEMLAGFPVTDPYLRGNLYTCLIYARREMFDFEQVIRYDARAQALYEQSGSRFVLIWHNSILGPTELARGRLVKAEQALSFAGRIAAEISGERSALAAMPGLLLSEVFYERNQLDACQWLLEEYLPLADQIGFVDQLIAGYISQARLWAAAGDRDAARDILDRAETLSVKWNFERLAAHVAAERVRQALLEADFEAVKRMSQSQFAQTRLNEMAPHKEVTSRHATMAMTWCRLACVNGRLGDALALSRKWIKFAGEQGALRVVVAFTALLARAHQQKGEAAAAVRTLRKGVAIARQAGFVRTLIDQPELTPTLLGALVEAASAEHDQVGRYAKELLQIIAPEAASVSLDLDPNASISVPVEGLNEREREILQLVADGLLNREIAATLGLTEGTVKWRLQQIFEKVGTHRRSKAVQRARELGFLR